MGWKDLMKNVTDKATSVAETAQAKFEEQKQLSAIKKEEQNKKMEEMNERVTEYEQELLQNILSGFSGAPCIEVEDNILDFTKDYFEKLLLPANSVSASKITMYPYSDKIQKKAQKALREYDDTETPVFQFEGNKGEFILMTPTKLYIAVAFPENQTFIANVAVDLQQVSQLGFVSTEEGRKMYKVLKNESDFDDWIRVLPDEVSVVSTQTAVKNSLKEVLQRFDTAYGKERRIEADLGGFAIVLFGDRTEVFEQEKNVLKYFKLNADEYEYEEIYKQKEPECTVEVTFRLYLCSSDYAVQVVRVLKKENENG